MKQPKGAKIDYAEESQYEHLVADSPMGNNNSFGRVNDGIRVASDGIHGFWKQLDKTYLKPMFGGSESGAQRRGPRIDQEHQASEGHRRDNSNFVTPNDDESNPDNTEMTSWMGRVSGEISDDDDEGGAAGVLYDPPPPEIASLKSTTM